MAGLVARQRSRIRPRLKEGEARRYAVVDEDNPDRMDLVAVVSLRGAWTWASGGPAPPEFERACAAYVVDNLGLAVDFARGLSPDHVPEGDVVRACALGMLTALRRFDLSKAGKFSTYAVWWMKHETGQLLYRDEAGAGVAVPSQLRDDRRELEAVLQVLTHLLQREPDDEEVARALAGAARREKGPDPARWDAGKVREVRTAYVGHRHKTLYPNAMDHRQRGGPRAEDPEAVLDLRRALATLPAALRAVLAEEFDLGETVPGAVPEDPFSRALLLDLAVRRLRALVGP